MFGAQATGCSPVSVAYKAGVDAIRPVRPDTIAKSLAIGNPADGVYVLDICRRTGGAVEDITDEEVRAGILLLARNEGIFTETAGGTTVGVLKKLVETGQARPHARDRHHQHRHGPQDARRGRRRGGAACHDRPVVRRLRRHRHRLTRVGAVSPARGRRVGASYPARGAESAQVSPRSIQHMSVSVRIPTILRTYTGGESEVSAEGATLAEVLDNLDASYSGIKGRILDEAGEPAPLRQRVRRERRRPLPREPRDRHPGRQPDLGHPRRRRRLTSGFTAR